MSAPEVLAVTPRGGAITVVPDAEQWTTWSAVAGDTPLDRWLADLADQACVDDAVERTWPAIIKLQRPFEWAGSTISSIEMREGRIGDMKGLKLSGELPLDQVITVASRLSGQPTQVIEKLAAVDAGEVMSIALGFYVGCLGTGRKRSR